MHWGFKHDHKGEKFILSFRLLVRAWAIMLQLSSARGFCYADIIRLTAGFAPVFVSCFELFLGITIGLDLHNRIQ